MTYKNIDVTATLAEIEKLLKKEKNISPALRATIKILMVVVSMMADRLSLNSRNSSKPPSTDLKKFPKKKRDSTNKPGGQKGHTGTTLTKVPNPDETIKHKVRTCEQCSRNISKQQAEKHVTRQVFEIEIKVQVTEHEAEVKICACGTTNTGKFPQGVSKAVQYGSTVKALSTYMSLYQLIPYKRVEDFFRDQIGLPISSGTIFNINKDAYDQLEQFELEIKEKLLLSAVNHSDETGININGGKHWLHTLSNDKLTLFYPHKKRGCEAINEMGILPKYEGILCHDHWKPYYTYKCIHSLCNSHHIRELEFAFEQDNQKWAKQMIALLVKIKKGTEESGVVPESNQKKFIKRYRTILTKGKVECPVPEKEKGKRGRQKKSKSRNLLERLEEYENDVLLFMKNENVPFTNNLAENDIRMTKVHQKISGCFRSMEGAKIFCRVRSYLSTARKNKHTSHLALTLLFLGLNLNDAE